MFDNIFGWLGSLLSTLAGFFAHVFDYIKHTILPFIIRRYQAIEAFLNKYLGPIVRFLQRVRAWYFAHVFPILHAILEVIARIRAALLIFRILGVKWAAKLDADLQLLQAWVTQFNATIVAALNTVSTVIGLVIDPAGIIRRDFFVGTLFSSLAAVKRAAGYGADSPTSPTDQAFTDAGNAEVQGTIAPASYTRDAGFALSDYQSTVRDDMNSQFAEFGDPQTVY